MNIKLLFAFVCIHTTLNFAAASSSSDMPPKITAVLFDRIPRRTPLRHLVDNPIAFEKTLGGEKDPLTFKQRSLRFQFLKQLQKDRPFDREAALVLTVGNSLPVSTGLILTAGLDPNCLIDEKYVNFEITPLCMSLLNNAPLSFVKKLVSLGAEVNRPSSTGETPLYCAVACERLDTVNYLLEMGADPNIARSDKKHKNSITNKALGITPIYYAAERGLIDIMKALLQKKADPNRVSAEGVSPLHMAAQEGQVEAVELLINSGAKINALTEWKDTPLLSALFKQREREAQKLIERGANVVHKNKNGLDALLVAASKNMHALIPQLISRGSDLNSVDNNGNSSLMAAVMNGHAEAVKKLLDTRWNPLLLLQNAFGMQAYPALNGLNKQGIWPLYVAALKNNAEIFTMLVRAKAALGIGMGVDNNMKSILTALTQSKGSDLSEILTCCKMMDKELFNKLANLKLNGNLPIHDAALCENTQVLEFLLEMGADRNAKNDKGMTALDIARKIKNAKAVALLKKH